MHPQYKLIRFSNGEQIIGEVLEEKDFTITVRNMFKAINRETRQGYVTGVIKWLTYIEEEPVKLNKEHVTFTSVVSDEIVEYLKMRDDEDEVEHMSIEDMEREYKQGQLEMFLRHANTNPTMQ